jgi:uncharacterized protein
MSEPTPEYILNELKTLAAYTRSSAALARRSLATTLGKQFDGRRDVYEAVGYPSTIDFRAYLGKYRREGVATRIVNAPAEETWRVPPTVRDAGETADAFNKAFNDLTDVEAVNPDIEREQPKLWEAIAQADKWAGIGQYGVLVMGINDGGELHQPLKPAKDGARGPKALLYLNALTEKQAEIVEWETDRKNPRFGKPTMYQCDFGEVGETLSLMDVRVHWSRVIHIAENAGGAGVYGTPRLEAVFNNLEDILKIMAGAGEAAWRLINKGIIASTKEGYALDDDDEVTNEKVEEYIHDLKRYLLLEGMDIKVEGGEIVDPSGVIRISIALISAATGIPQRILLGSEAGHLASTQDETAWKETIAARQTQFGEKIARTLVNRLIWSGVLPMPQDGRYAILWPSLFTPTEAEQAEINYKRAQTLALLSPPGAPDAYVEQDEVRVLAGLRPTGKDSFSALLDEEDGVE